MARRCSICGQTGHIASNRRIHPDSQNVQKPTVHSGDIVLERRDILLFYVKNAKHDNDRNNKIRETILTSILNKEIPYEFYEDIEYGSKWMELKSSWNRVLDDISNMRNIYGSTSVICKQKGGRKYNYDFDIEYYRHNKCIGKVCVEFKYGGKSLYNIPQFLSLQVKSDPFFRTTYDWFYYTYYLDQYIECDDGITINKPSFDDYKKQVSSILPKTPFFRQLKSRESINKRDKNIIVNRSITDYLQTHWDQMDSVKFVAKIKATQTDKIFVMWDQGRFYIDSLALTKCTNMKIEGVFNGNVLRVSDGNLCFNLLLRWRNHKGVLNPAWQISVKQYKNLI